MRRSRKIFGVLLTGISALIIASCDPQAGLYPGDTVERIGFDMIGVDLVPNGGFEKGLEDWEFFRCSGCVSTGFQVNTDKTYVRTGERSVYINNKSEYRVTVPVPTERLPVTVSLWVKDGGAGTGTLQVVIATTDSDGEYSFDSILTVSGTDNHADWTEYKADVVLSDALEPYLYLESSANVNLYIDDVELRIRED